MTQILPSIDIVKTARSILHDPRLMIHASCYIIHALSLIYRTPFDDVIPSSIRSPTCGHRSNTTDPISPPPLCLRLTATKHVPTHVPTRPQSTGVYLLGKGLGRPPSILSSMENENVYSRAKGIADHYWTRAVFSLLPHVWNYVTIFLVYTLLHDRQIPIPQKRPICRVSKNQIPT